MSTDATSDQTPAAHAGSDQSGTAGVLVGVLALVAGAAAIVFPLVSGIAIALLIGWVLVLGALLVAARAFAQRAGGAALLIRLAFALFMLVAGIYLLVAPLRGALALAFVLGLCFLLVGGARLLLAWQERHDPDARAVGLNGVVSVIIGVILISFPGIAAWTIGLMVGIDFLLFGATTLAVAGRRGREAPAA